MPKKKTTALRQFVIDLDADPLQLGVEEPAGGAHLLPVEIPTPERYSRLIRRLARASRRLDDGDDELKTAATALVATISFLHEDGAVLRGGVTRPLTLLATAVHDAVMGGRPPLIFARQRAQNRPAGTAFDNARGQIAAALSALVCAGVQTGKAASWLADELAVHGITHPDGKPINGSTLRRWREDVRQDKTSDVIARMYDRVMQQASKRTAPSDIPARENAQRWCRALVRSLGAIFPKSPPSAGKP